MGALTEAGPVRVVIIDVDLPLPDIDCRHPTSERYKGIWVLAVRGDSPLGLVDVPVSGDFLRGSSLASVLREQLGEQWDRSMPPGDLGGPLPSMAVVVPTNLGRPGQLRVCVESLRTLDYPDYEIIVVDNRPDPSPEHELLTEMADWPRVRVVRERRPGISAARNRGVEATTAEFVAFTDDDVRVHPKWLSALGRRFTTEPQLDALSGLVLPEELETEAQLLFEQSSTGLHRGYQPLTFRLTMAQGTWWQRLISPPRIERYEAGKETTSSPLYATGDLGFGSNMAFRTSSLRELGGFDCALGVGTATCGGEDLAMFLELLISGRSMGYEPSAIVHHTHRRTLEDLEVQLRGYGAGFSAMMLSLLWNDRRRVGGFISTVPLGMWALTKPDSTKRSARGEEYPKELARAELRGLLTGPVAYVRERRAGNRWVS